VISAADFTYDRSGSFDFATGVGTEIKTKSASLILVASVVNSNPSSLGGDYSSG